MMQTSLFDEPAHTVEPCPACKCCDRVDGVCLGSCESNRHKRRARGIMPAPAEGGWTSLEPYTTS